MGTHLHNTVCKACPQASVPGAHQFGIVMLVLMAWEPMEDSPCFFDVS